MKRRNSGTDSPSVIEQIEQRVGQDWISHNEAETKGEEMWSQEQRSSSSSYDFGPNKQTCPVLVKGDLLFNHETPKGPEALEILARDNTLLMNQGSINDSIEVVSCFNYVKSDRCSQFQFIFLILCLSAGIIISGWQFSKAYEYETAELKPKKIDRTMTYFQPGSPDYEQPYYYFMFVANGLTNESWIHIAEEYGWIMETLGYNTTGEDFWVMDERKALYVAELYFRFPGVFEVEGMSQTEQFENYLYPIYESYELSWWDVLERANLRMMYFYCGSLASETVTMGPSNYSIWAEFSQDYGEYIVVIKVKFDDFKSSDVSYQPYCKFDIYTNDIFNFREEVDMRLIFFASRDDLTEGREDEVCWYQGLNTGLEYDEVYIGVADEGPYFVPALGGGTSWGSLQEYQSTASWIEVPDDSVLHEYGQVIYYRMSESKTDGVSTLKAHTDSWRHPTPELIEITVYHHPTVDEWETYAVYGFLDAISSLGANWTLITLVFFTVTRFFAERNKKTYGILPYLSKQDLVALELRNVIEIAGTHDYNLRYVKAGVGELEKRKTKEISYAGKLMLTKKSRSPTSRGGMSLDV